MKRLVSAGPCDERPSAISGISAESGFSLVEFMFCSLVLVIVAGGVFDLLGRTQRAASYQTEVQTVTENTRIAMETLTRTFSQAGNDPLEAGFPAITITDATQVRVRSDLTGSVGQPDKGDPDGDTSDLNEDLTIRYNADADIIEFVSAGIVQPVASNISAFTMEYFDANDAGTNVGDDVRRIRINMTGRSTSADPQTGQFFSMQWNSDVKLLNR